MARPRALPVVLVVAGLVLLSGCCGVPGNPQNRFSFSAADQLPDGTLGSYYEYSFCDPATGAVYPCGSEGTDAFNPSGGASPYSFDLGPGGDPLPNLFLESNGFLQGTPNATGNFTFAVCAQDTAEASACRRVSLLILGLGEPGENPVIPPVPPNPGPGVAPVTPTPKTGKVSITSGSCSVVEMYDPQFSETYRNLGMNYARVYQVQVSGSMEGPNNTEFRLTTDPYIGYSEPETLSCGAWTNDPHLTSCINSDAKQGSVDWSYATKAAGEQVQVKEFVVTIHATVSIDGEVVDEATYPIQCPTVKY